MNPTTSESHTHNNSWSPFPNISWGMITSQLILTSQVTHTSKIWPFCFRHTQSTPHPQPPAKKKSPTTNNNDVLLNSRTKVNAPHEFVTSWNVLFNLSKSRGHPVPFIVAFYVVPICMYVFAMMDCAFHLCLHVWINAKGATDIGIWGGGNTFWRPIIFIFFF